MTLSPYPKPLRFPRGVRFPHRNELPQGNETLFDRIASANITTGYVRKDRDEGTYSTYFEANIHADEVFGIFNKLALSLMPDIAAPIIGLKDEEPIFGPYTFTEAALSIFEPHSELLENDGFLEFGITFQRDRQVEEVFVKSPKYFQIWTNQPGKVIEVFYEFGIPDFPQLEFIDEYPMVSKSINRRGDAAWPSAYESIKAAFEELPAVLPEQ